MQTYHVILKSEVAKSFRAQRAANSLDIDTAKKSIHELKVDADIGFDFSVGLIVGASGSGKTSLAKEIFGKDCFRILINTEKPIIDQLPEKLSYDECAQVLSGIGLTSVPCWIRPVNTLSNGQRARAEAVLGMTAEADITVLDEWTSVVDRTVAKVMSHSIQKFSRRNKRQIVLLSCHYDVIEWLNPDWIIDCNNGKFIDRRLLQPKERERKEILRFDVTEVDRSSWKYFSKYHYLSSNLPGGRIFTFGLFHKGDQIGFSCLANYVPKRKLQRMILHSNRTVVHPDYLGFGIGARFSDICCAHLVKEYRILSKFSSEAMFRGRMKNPRWKLLKTNRQIGAWSAKGRRNDLRFSRDSGFRSNVRTWTFEFIGPGTE